MGDQDDLKLFLELSEISQNLFPYLINCWMNSGISSKLYFEELFSNPVGKFSHQLVTFSIFSICWGKNRKFLTWGKYATLTLKEIYDWLWINFSYYFGSHQVSILANDLHYFHSPSSHIYFLFFSPHFDHFNMIKVTQWSKNWSIGIPFPF